MIKYCGCVSQKMIRAKLKPVVGVAEYLLIPNRNLNGHVVQDMLYGEGRRVMNLAPKYEGFRCTVCEKVLK